MVIFNLVKQRIFQYPRLGMFWDKARWSPISANMTIWYVVYWSSKRVETTKHHQTIAGKLSCALPLFLYFSLFFSLSLSLSLSLFFFFLFFPFFLSLPLPLSLSLIDVKNHIPGHRYAEYAETGGTSECHRFLLGSAEYFSQCDQVLAKTRYCNLRKRPHAPFNQLFPWFSTNQIPWALVFFPCFWRPQCQQGKHPPRSKLLNMAQRQQNHPLKRVMVDLSQSKRTHSCRNFGELYDDSRMKIT